MADCSKVLLQQGRGASYWVLGDLYTFKATGKETGGAFTVVDEVVQAHNGPPLHLHRVHDETFYVLEGKFSFRCGEQESLFEAGSFIYIPKGALHTFKNIDDKPGKLLVTISPAGLEEFFYAIGAPANDLSTPVPPVPHVMDTVTQLAPQYQLEVMLPKEE